MNIKFFLKRYKYALLAFILLFLTYLINKNLGMAIFKSSKLNFIQMLTILPPIMILLGLIDTWVSREYIMKYMGANSGFLGVILSILIASIAAGPMYAAFPFTTVFINKGVKFSNIIIFLNSWCVIKISTLLFEIGSLGYKFTITRLIIDIFGVIIMGYLVEYLCNQSIFHRKKIP